MEAKKSDDIGMRRGRILPNLPQTKQLDVIAEGLPVLMKSAEDLLAASKALDEHHRGATILDGHAREEIAKILILMDIVRCPPKLRQSRIGPMMGWFYDHLARLIYVEAQSWRPVDVKQLQDYVDDNRKSHYLEGAVGEYILPNWTIYARESLLYADIVTHEDGEPMWNEPDALAPAFRYGEPLAWRLCQALRDMGAFTRAGLDITSSIWSQIDFAETQNWSDARNLTREMLIALQKAGLITDAAREEQLGPLYNDWQLPMYRIDFTRISVPLADLQVERDANLWSEMGY
ncbi:hypothetical protein [Azospirillum brasilense]|uniref:hypothetical protein n=1 Tax=Azospirillum brasilense TaxID=192 RepID=UPI000E0C7668|nr:hypothetical protein [Azospirillum brasilense]